MKNYLSLFSLLLFVSFVSQKAIGQNLKLTSSVGVNKYIDTDDIFDSYNLLETSAQSSYSLKLDFESGSEGFLTNSYAKIEHYGGSFYNSPHYGFCGLDMMQNFLISNQKVSKTVLSFGSYLLSQEIAKDYKIRLGAEVGYLLDSSFERITYSENPSRSARTTTFNSQLDPTLFQANAVMEIQLGKWFLSKTFSISPVYNFSFSLNPEFKNEYEIRSHRHSLGLAFTL